MGIGSHKRKQSRKIKDNVFPLSVTFLHDKETQEDLSRFNSQLKFPHPKVSNKELAALKKFPVSSVLFVPEKEKKGWGKKIQINKNSYMPLFTKHQPQTSVGTLYVLMERKGEGWEEVA